jgi:hypothetical protein
LPEICQKPASRPLEHSLRWAVRVGLEGLISDPNTNLSGCSIVVV